MRNCFRLAALAAGIFSVISILAVVNAHAYYLSTDERENRTGVGVTRISIEEEFSPGVLGSEASVTEGITKIVNIRNTGKGPVAVRVRADFSDSEMKDKVDVDWNRDLWEESGDGFWYYRGVILSEDDESTAYDDTVTKSPLFTRVKLDSGLSDDEISDFEIYIRAESRNCSRDARYEDIEW